MPTYKDLIKELKYKASNIERKEEKDTVQGVISAMKAGAEVLVVYDKDSGIVRIYDIITNLVLAEGDRQDEMDTLIFDILKEMSVSYYLTNEVCTVIGLKNRI